MGVTKNHPPYYKNYVADDLNDVEMLTLSNEQRGILHILKAWQWSSRDGLLPVDPKAILAMVGIKPESTDSLSTVSSCFEASAKQVLGVCFDVLQKFFQTSENHPGKIFNNDLRNQWLSYQSIVKQKIEAGKKGGESKASIRNSKHLASAKHLPSTSLASAKHPPIYSDSDTKRKNKSKTSLRSENAKSVPLGLKPRPTSLRAVQNSSLRYVQEEEKSKSADLARVESGDTEPSPANPEGRDAVADYEPQAFQDLWDSWPKQEGYTTAKGLWNALQLPKKTIGKIFHDLPKWKHYGNYTRIYAPKLENYLKNKGWLDNPPVPIIC